MTPHEKAVSAINSRLERLQANLRDAQPETVQQFLFQSLVVTLGMSEALNDYIKTVGQYAQRRHGAFKQASGTVSERHADLLKSGRELLERFKANPTDRALRQEIERAKKEMEGIQKNLRRDAFAVQRELSRSMAMIDHVADSVRRICAAEKSDALKRGLQELVGHLRELYAALKATLPAKNLVDASAWESAALSALEPATDFHDAYARAGHQAMLALETMTLAVSETPPQSAEDATHRANAAAAARLKEITARFTAGQGERMGSESQPPG